MKVKCNSCGKIVDKKAGHVNRANKLGLNLYCNRLCSGIGRSGNKSKAQKAKEKSDYDKDYRRKNRAIIKAKKKLYYEKDFIDNPSKYKNRTTERKAYHKAYKSTEKYKKYKREYDQKHKAKLHYGEYWESSILLRGIYNEIPNREVKQELNLINKSQKRKKAYEKGIKC